ASKIPLEHAELGGEAILAVTDAFLKHAGVAVPGAGVDPGGDGDLVGGIESRTVGDGDVGVGGAVEAGGAVDFALRPAARGAEGAGVAIAAGVGRGRAGVLVKLPACEEQLDLIALA